MHRIIQNIQNSDEKVQKRHLARALQFLSNFANFATEAYKEILSKALPAKNAEELLELLKPLESAVNIEFKEIKFENFVKRLHQRVYQ